MRLTVGTCMQSSCRVITIDVYYHVDFIECGLRISAPLRPQDAPAGSVGAQVELKPLEVKQPPTSARSVAQRWPQRFLCRLQ